MRNWVGSLSQSKSLRFIFANGDEPPSRDLRTFLVQRGHAVFSHNLLDGEEGVTPIPLGLQNATHRKFGVVNDFLLTWDEFRQPPLEKQQRDLVVYGNFSPSSNPSEREPLKKMLENSRFGFSEAKLSVRLNRANMLRAKFVPSPAGLGPDCYRTWEALYLGAVPVVRQGTIATSITEGLPIWVVEDWAQLIDATDSELESKFLELSALPRWKALFPYWQSVICGRQIET